MIRMTRRPTLLRRRCRLRRLELKRRLSFHGRLQRHQQLPQHRSLRQLRWLRLRQSPSQKPRTSRTSPPLLPPHQRDTEKNIGNMSQRRRKHSWQTWRILQQARCLPSTVLGSPMAPRLLHLQPPLQRPSLVGIVMMMGSPPPDQHIVQLRAFLRKLMRVGAPAQAQCLRSRRHRLLRRHRCHRLRRRLPRRQTLSMHRHRRLPRQRVVAGTQARVSTPMRTFTFAHTMMTTFPHTERRHRRRLLVCRVDGSQWSRKASIIITKTSIRPTGS